MNTPTPTTEDPRLGWTSASNAQADELCPGRHNAQKGLPDQKGEWAQYGQAIHAALADSSNAPVLNALTPEQRDMFDAHREIEKKVISQIWPDENGSTPSRVWRHQRYWCNVPERSTQDGDRIATSGSLFPHSGEADMVMRRGNKAFIQDYKSLAGDVPESPKNKQLRDLSVMVWRTLKVDEIFVVINQPLVTWSPEICRYTKEDLERAEQEMWARVRKSNDPNAQRIASEVACKFCKAANICKEHAAWRASLLPEKESPLAIEMASWSIEQRGIVADHLPRLRKLLDDAEAYLKVCLINDPESVPGYWLKPGDERDTIVNPQELFDRFTELASDNAKKIAEQQPNEGTETPEERVQKIIVSQFMKCVKIANGKLEAEVRAVTKLKGKALKAKVEKLMEGIVETKQNAPSLAKKKEVT